MHFNNLFVPPGRIPLALRGYIRPLDTPSETWLDNDRNYSDQPIREIARPRHFEFLISISELCALFNGEH